MKNPYQESDELASPEEILEQYNASNAQIESIQNKIINVLSEALK